MPDVYATINELDHAMQERLAGVLETRGADPQQQAMRRDFLGAIELPEQARVLEVGCGTGVLTRRLAGLPDVGEVLGVDPAGFLIERARSLATGFANLRFEVGDGRAMPLEDRSFDLVVFDSTLSHVPGPERALAEALRVLRPGGQVALFDGDYATATVALGDHDPLQACVAATMASSVHDRWFVRRAPGLVRGAGFADLTFRSHGFVELGDGQYMLSVVDRGADLLAAAGQLGDAAAAALKAEARRRVAAGSFFGHIAYGSVRARRPG